MTSQNLATQLFKGTNVATKNMDKCWQRLETYATFPHTNVDKFTLAEAGFFYTGKSDTVKCAFCAGKLNDWRVGNIAMSEHLRAFPHCPFLTSLRPVVTFDQAGPSFSTPNTLAPNITNRLQLTNCDGNHQIAMVNPSGCRFAAFATVNARLNTYAGFPADCPLQPNELAHAGFWYEGHGDRVKCFHCGDGLFNWRVGDIPMQEHAKFSPRCPNLQLHAPPGAITNRSSNSSSSRHSTDERGPNLRSSKSCADLGEISREALIRENMILKEKGQCTICMNDHACILLLPCRHLCMCATCAPAVTQCPLCRHKIHSLLRVFFN